MRNIAYLFFALSLAACSSNETKQQQNYSTTPGGLAGLQQPTQQTTNPTDSNVKVNPAHGAPGHDCALPVGAPLNAAQTTAPSAAENTVPTTTNPTPTNTDTKAKLNPAHGMPGHDCAKPVGAPLS
jgi:hypothetical protein